MSSPLTATGETGFRPDPVSEPDIAGMFRAGLGRNSGAGWRIDASVRRNDARDVARVGRIWKSAMTNNINYLGSLEATIPVRRGRPSVHTR
jgi:hypothetical protein